jgi:hypothetical protein
MSGFVLHPDALADLNEILEYIAVDNPSAAVLPLGKFCASALAPSLEWRYFDFD